MTTATLSDRELATTLAALRSFQNMLPLQNLNAKAWLDISTDSGRLAPLSIAEVEDLCWKLNRPDEANKGEGEEGEEEEAPAPPPPEDLTTLPASHLIVRLAGCFGAQPCEPNFTGVLTEVGRRIKEVDEQREDQRRLAVSAFAKSASVTVSQIWRAVGGRTMTDAESKRFAAALFDFFKTVR